MSWDAAATATPASSPPPLHGLDPAWSRVVTVPETPTSDHAPDDDARVPAPGPAPNRTRRWHLLDNAARLAELGVTPVGTLLCVHGNPTWAYLWRRLLSAATAAAAEPGAVPWRVVAVDQLEMGFSERGGTQRRLARRVRDLGDLTDALELAGPVVTVGHDWGGVISLGWAVDHPDQLAGVVLLNTAVDRSGAPVPSPLRVALRPPVHAAATARSPAFLEATLALARRPLAGAVKAAYRAPYPTAGTREGIAAFVADIPVGPDHPSAAELERVATGVRDLTVPALMLWGPQDPIFSDRYLDDLLGRLPHADVHRFEGAGHLVAEDVDYAPSVLGWLADRRPGGDAPTQRAQGRDDPAPPHLWQHLDALHYSPTTALVEMAPPHGAAPRVVTWRLLSRRVRELAAGLSRAGVRKGDRVALLIPPGADLTAVLYACLRIGAVVVIADAGLGVRGLTRAMRGAWPDHVIGALPGLTAARALGWPGRRISTTPLPAPVAAALGVWASLADLTDLGSDQHLPPEPGPDDVAAVLFTSGSTGPAKGVVYTHAQLGAVPVALAAHYGIGVGTGLVAGFAPFALLGPALGTRSVTPDMDVTAPRTLTAPAVAAAVAAVDAEVLFLSPAALANVVATADRLTDADHAALAGVRTFLSAGAPVPQPLLTQAAQLMPNATPHTPYGMTEGLLLADITLDELERTGQDEGPGGACVGRPSATSRILVDPLDDDGHPTGAPGPNPGVTGEVVVSAPHLKDHYDRLYLTDRASLRGCPPGRWHRTGDVGHLDGEGRLWIEGRLAHVVVTADGVVTPVGPEQRIESVPAVRRAALVGVGPRGTQQLVAVVETDASRAGLAPADLAAAVRAATPEPLAAVLAVPGLPTDVRHNSKIDRTALAEWAQGVLSGGRWSRP